MQQRKFLSNLYAGLFLLALALILLVNGWLMGKNTKEKLTKLYWNDTIQVASTISLSAKNSIRLYQVTPEYLVYYAQNLAKSLGEKSFSKKDLTNLLTTNHLEEIALYDQEGNLQLEAKNKSSTPTEEIQTVAADFGGKTLLIGIGPDKIFDIKAREALQQLAKRLMEEGLVESISFYDHHMITIADSDPARIGQGATNQSVKDVYKNKTNFFYPKDSHFGMIDSFELDDEGRVGVFHLGMATNEIDVIYQETMDSAILFSTGVMLAAILIVVIVMRFQANYFYKLELMQKKMQENEKLLSLGNLAAGVAHEVRNPLNSISITIQRLQLEYTPPEEQEAKEYQSFLGVMKGEVDRLNQIITDFLSFAKPFSPKMQDFSINDFLDHCLTLFSQEAEQAKVRVLTERKIRDDHFYGDQEKLKQVFFNLAQNALEACLPGKTIKIRSYQNRLKEWILEIIDEGEGITPKKLNQIFDIYFTTKQNGTGLGLYISRKIIQAHAGHIDLTPNADGIGITATITLPKVDF